MNLALYSNQIMPDRCLVHGCSNRSDMNAGFSAHFSPTIKRERDTWLGFVHTQRANLNPSEKFVAGVFSPFRGGMFFKSVSYGRLSSSAYSWLNSYNTILSKLQYCVNHEVFFFVEVSYMFFSQTFLRFVNIFSSNSLSLVPGGDSHKEQTEMLVGNFEFHP